MISKHRSTTWVRTWDKCGIAALGMKAWEEVEKWCGREASLPNKVLRYAMSLSGNHDLRHGLDGSVETESCRRGDFSTCSAAE